MKEKREEKWRGKRENKRREKTTEKEREKQEKNRHEKGKGKGDSRHWCHEYFSLVFSLFSLYFYSRVQSTCSL